MWAEYSEDLQSVRFFSRNGPLTVSAAKHKLQACSGEGEPVQFPLPLDYPVEELQTQTSDSADELAYLTVRLNAASSVSSDTVHALSSSSALAEDWMSMTTLNCRSCKSTVLDLSDLTPCLLPSATWGFEDMRVCEECGPLVSGSTHHSHGPKKGRKTNIYVSETDVIVDSKLGGVRSCPHCDCAIGLPLTEGEVVDYKSIISHVTSEWVRIPKRNLAGPVFGGYTDSAEFFTARLDSKKVAINDLIFLKFVTGNRDIVLAVDGGYCWASRVMYCVDPSLVKQRDTFESAHVEPAVLATIQRQLEKFALPSSFSVQRNWTSSLVQLTPVILEL